MENGIPKLQYEFDRDPMIGSKVMSLLNRSSSVARPDIIITDNQFLTHCMEKGIRKLQ